MESNDSCMTMDETGMLVPDYDQTIKIFDDGDIVVGEVVRIDRDEVLVDIGYKSEGAVPLKELSIRSDVDPDEVVSVGDRIEALVLQKEDKDGRLILSKKRADYEKSWERIEKIAQADEIIKGFVIEVVKGGLIVDIGLRGFLPASLVDTKRTKDLGQFMEQEMECRIIEMDRNRNNVVLSRRAVLEEEKKHEKSKILEKITKGAVLSGKISSIVDFGAFVDLGGIDGLIHISELSWNHIDHPSEVVTVGDDVNVQVLEIELDRERISLGLRQTQEDPWKERAGKYSVGQVCAGRATKLVPFGVFVEIEEGLEGLIHISELAHRHIEMPSEVVKPDEAVETKIVGIDFDKRRVSLSIKQLTEVPKNEESEDEKTEDSDSAVADSGDKEEAVVTKAAAEEVAEPEIRTEEQAQEEGGREESEDIKAEETIAENSISTEAELAENTESEAGTIEVVTEPEAEKVSDVEEEQGGANVDPDSLEGVLKQMKAEHSKK